MVLNPFFTLVFAAVPITLCVGEHPSIRLDNSTDNGFSGAEGIVQVWRDDKWNYINGSTWDYIDASIACKELGYAGVADFSSTDTTFPMPKEVILEFIDKFNWEEYFQRMFPLILKAAGCLDGKQQVIDCVLDMYHKDIYSYMNKVINEMKLGNGAHIDDVATVSCTGFNTARLTGGTGPHEGRVEVFYDNSWGTVCDDDWGIEDANVLCKELGYPRALSAVGSAAFGEGHVQQNIWMDDTDCRGNETSLLRCQKKTDWKEHNCVHAEDASAICKTSITAPVSDGHHPSIRLQNGQHNTLSGAEGVVQMWHDDVWTFVNGSDWDYPDARVACRELGYDNIAAYSDVTLNFTDEMIHELVTSIDYDELKQKVKVVMIQWMDCIGSERSLLECTFEIYAEGVGHVFGNLTELQDVAYVSCTDMKTARLTGGSGPHEGRVEVFYDNSWGTVCDDDWGMEDANVLCKELGYRGALAALGNAAFGEGYAEKKIWMDDIQCLGNETSLMLCQKNKEWGEHDCKHTEDASVICDTIFCPKLPVIAHGTRSTDRTDVGTEVLFMCEEGFVMLGDEQITCLTIGSWNGKVPTCNIVKSDPQESDKDTAVHTHLSDVATVSVCLGTTLAIAIAAILVVAIYWLFFRKRDVKQTLQNLSVPLINEEHYKDV